MKERIENKIRTELQSQYTHIVKVNFKYSGVLPWYMITITISRDENLNNLQKINDSCDLICKMLDINKKVVYFSVLKYINNLHH
jgi:hypothetical protein